MRPRYVYVKMFSFAEVPAKLVPSSALAWGIMVVVRIDNEFFDA